MADRSLREYERKRDFSKTAEPKPKKAASDSERRMFVIQKHDASRLHYDFRLELDGALKSWAVPKGVPYKKGDKRLAVHVEDHPMDYAGFEGIIPKGQYGGGTVMVWDTGTWEPLGGKPAQDLRGASFTSDCAARRSKANGPCSRSAAMKTTNGSC
jgi:bifunctional non-homologous end joining protein LigD